IMLLNLLAQVADVAEEGEPVETNPGTTAGNIFSDWFDKLFDTTTVWGQIAVTAIKVVLALVVLGITFAIINAITKKIYKNLQKKHKDETLSRVGTQVLRITLKVLIAVCLIGFVGIETASISALIASIGVGISLAVQGTLSNFAGGVIIIVMRPFKIGDYIVSNGQEGTVEDIKLFYTHIVTNDNKMVVIPNGSLANNVIVNSSAKDTRRVDMEFNVAYGSDVAKVKEIILATCAKNELVFKEPAPFAEMSNLGASSLDFTVRVWCNRPDYWTVKFALIDAIKTALEENGIEIPFNQVDVHIKPQDNA
ncbi:MAG: mechanosensitive ion channel family protein, partial [Clostridia bacterium]|nr:mechanosensitive ion channel family protein [Clostridia bacterium]